MQHGQHEDLFTCEGSRRDDTFTPSFERAKQRTATALAESSRDPPKKLTCQSQTWKPL
jgi:hypothetical protein